MGITTYTNAYYSNNKLHLRGLDENGTRLIQLDVDYQPTVWVPLEFSLHPWKDIIIAQQHNQWKTMIENKAMTGVVLDSIASARKFVQQNNKFVDGGNGSKVNETKVHTAPTNMFISQYLAENFKHDQHVKSDQLKIYTYDIETEVGHRNVDNDTRVKCRTIVDSNNFGEQPVTKSMTIAKFETLPNRDQWELYNPDTKQWCSYNEHPYRYIGGFPEPMKADERITLITVKDINQSQIYTWGLFDFVNDREDVTYFKFENEYELLKHFVEWWSDDYPDVQTGWNTSVFDQTYVSNRVKKILGVEYMNRLSPYGIIDFKEVDHNEYGNSVVETTWAGISNLDYLKLYKKFTYGNRESYKLDAIAEDEIGIKKVPNPTGGTFKDFYTGDFDVFTQPEEDDHEIRKLGYQRTQIHKLLLETPDDKELKSQFKKLDNKIKKMCHQIFTEYNIRDVELVDKIDNKRHFIDLIMMLGHMARCNFEDIFSPTRTWEHLIFNHCNNNNMVIPIKKMGTKTAKFAGAYVKSPLVGKHEFCESFDLDSLYPHLLMQYNISPETILRNPDGSAVKMELNLDKLVHKTEDTDFAHKNNISVAASGVCFTKERWGIIPQFCHNLYADRKANKKKYLKSAATLERVNEQLRKRGLL